MADFTNVDTMKGGTLWVSNTLPASDSLASFQSVTGWLKVAEVTDHGELPANYEQVSHVSVERGKTQTIKGARDAVTLTITTGRKYDDAAQQAMNSLADGANADNEASFKIVLPDDAGTIIYFAGPVTGVSTPLGGAGTVIGKTYQVACNTEIYEDISTKWTLTYTVSGSNGTILGTLTQTVADGANAEPVVAVADTGYNFSAWSDAYSKPVGIAEAGYRQDLAVSASADYTVTFVAE